MTETETSLTQNSLPVDPDIDVDDPRRSNRPVHLHRRYLGIVALGGALGTAARDAISTALPAHNGVSWSIFWINITGALLLGVLLESLARRGPDRKSVV